jgi:hypothetical protein
MTAASKGGSRIPDFTLGSRDFIFIVFTRPGALGAADASEVVAEENGSRTHPEAHSTPNRV